MNKIPVNSVPTMANMPEATITIMIRCVSRSTFLLRSTSRSRSCALHRGGARQNFIRHRPLAMGLDKACCAHIIAGPKTFDNLAEDGHPGLYERPGPKSNVRCCVGLSAVSTRSTATSFSKSCSSGHKAGFGVCILGNKETASLAG